MKIKRYKKVSKNLNFYVNNFGFRQPYQILIDGTFCFAALNNKINIEDNMPRYLQAELKFLTTQCVYMETEKLGKQVTGALIILKKFPIHKCGHEKRPIPGADCLLSMVGKTNNNHYMIATQDLDLQNKLRQIPGIPLLYLHQKTPVLEHPTEASIKSAHDANLGLGEIEKEVIQELKTKHGIVEPENKPKKKKKKGGPNPLSCKKKKKVSGVQTKSINKSKDKCEEIHKVRRKKIKIPKHVKEELFKNTNKT
ncbi:hypothetical protein ILUMI_03923 [Ignelater luminosus]|uniref:rRNA-processing protein UTP23 homolog n=1 Tax=Ignelater luminosus TaxID=2038154 RepID=A0A8K0DKS9_IGNLU|nr:hypothetical protein ILUMI_03923 [Ignelater luminosus]